MPKKVAIHDTNKVIHCLESHLNDSLMLEQLTKKLAIMLCLLKQTRGLKLPQFQQQRISLLSRAIKLLVSLQTVRITKYQPLLRY